MTMSYYYYCYENYWRLLRAEAQRSRHTLHKARAQSLRPEVVGDPGAQDMDLVCRAHQVVEDGSLDEV